MSLAKTKSVFSDKIAAYFSQSSISDVENSKEKKENINEMMADIGNIEFCLDYFIRLAKNN